MNRTASIAACAALLAVACGSPPPPPRRTAPVVAAAPKPVTDDEIKPLVPTNIYVYSPIGKRDPFQNQTVPQGFGRARETSGRAKTPLEKWGLDQLRLSMTVTGIHRDEVVITETITDHSTGRVYPQNVKLTVPVTRDEERDMKALQEGEHIGVATGEK